MPTVSVIIPAYNRAHLLKEAIDSVLAQDSKDFELIVVDDGSTDETPRLLESYNQISVVCQAHCGVSAARNAGTAIASGKLLAFLDSDDLWLPKKLSTQITFFEEHPHALICQTEELWKKDGVRINPKPRHRKDSGMIFERSVELCLVSPSAVMMQKSLLDEVGGFDEAMPACEDYDLWLRIGCRFPIYLIESPLVIKRGGHKDQLSQIPGLDRFRIYALGKLLASPPDGGLTPSQQRTAIAALSKKCEVYAAGCLKRGRSDEARLYLTLRENLKADCYPNQDSFERFIETFLAYESRRPPLKAGLERALDSSQNISTQAKRDLGKSPKRCGHSAAHLPLCIHTFRRSSSE